MVGTVNLFDTLGGISLDQYQFGSKVQPIVFSDDLSMAGAGTMALSLALLRAIARFVVERDR